MLNNLKELVKINSYNGGDEIVQYVAKQFSQFSKEIKIIKNIENDSKSVIIGINTNLIDVEPIVLSGHIDTVAPDKEKYLTNPLELIIKGNKAYGLGAIDMKSFVSIIFDNIEKIKKLTVPIIVALTTDEETNLFCIENVVRKFKELNIKPRFTIVGEPTKSQINNSANGCYEFEIEVFGKACHSSIIEQGINAINIMAKIITYIETEQKGFDLLTSNCGVICGGDIVNRVPSYCNLKFDIRSTSLEQIKLFLNLIINKIKKLKYEYKTEIKIKKLLEIPPLEIKNKEIIENIAKSLNVNIEKFMGGCEAGYYQALSGDAIIFGVGDMSLAHKPNEFVEIQEYNKYANLLMQLIDEIIKKYY